MSQISRLPLPSISLVLTTDHRRIPRHPSCIKVAPLPPLPTVEADNTRFDPMRTVHVREFKPEPYLEDRCIEKKDARREPIVYFKEVEPEDFTLAESIYEVPLQKKRTRVGKAIRRKVSRVFSSLRDVICIDIPRVCFCKACHRSR